MFFDGFTLTKLEVAGGHVRLRYGGSGPPLLMLHGNPQSHCMWNRVAPALAERFTVFCPDLRGYGRSFMPPATADHAPYAKREMARDMVDVMDHFGHQRFFLAGHDRGGRVAHRLALDFPDRVEKLAVLDIIPTIEHFERANMEFALGYYHWFWFAQPHPFPEVLIDAAPDAWFLAHTGRSASELFEPGGARGLSCRRAPSRRTSAACARIIVRPPASTSCTIGRAVPQARRSVARCLPCGVRRAGSPNGTTRWRSGEQYCAAEVTGGAVEAGHYIAEEAPTATLHEFRRFFG